MNKLISTTKDNLAIFTIVPALIGWFLQVLFLWNIGIPYIRFFSPSQVLSDWLLILWIILAIYFGFITAKLFFKEIINPITITRETTNRVLNIISNKNLFRLISTIWILGFCIYILYNLYIWLLSSEFTIINLYLFPFGISFILELLKPLIKDFLSSYWFKKQISKENTRNIILRLISFIILIALIKLFSIIFSETYRLFYLPTNLVNISNLNKDHQTEIIYFNDKYIFIQNKTDSKIIVKKFDDIFQK